MKEENRQSFELELRSAVHDISNGILYPEIAIQKILHAFDKAETPASEDWISVERLPTDFADVLCFNERTKEMRVCQKYYAITDISHKFGQLYIT